MVIPHGLLGLFQSNVLDTYVFERRGMIAVTGCFRLGARDEFDRQSLCLELVNDTEEILMTCNRII